MRDCPPVDVLVGVVGVSEFSGESVCLFVCMYVNLRKCRCLCKCMKSANVLRASTV